MHSALAVPEIVGLILECLTNEMIPVPGDIEFVIVTQSSWKIAQAALARSAAVCKAFANPALDRLWSYMVDLQPLFYLLPAFRAVERRGWMASIDGTISQSDHDRFDRYARRIRYLRLWEEKLDILASPAYMRVLHERGQISILPQLRQFFVLRGYEGLPSTLALTGTSLRDLSITSTIPEVQPSICSLVTALPDLSAGLRSVVLQAELSHACLIALFKLPGLEYLELNQRRKLTLHPKHILSLASASCIQELDVSSAISLDNDIEYIPNGSQDHVTFRALTRISIGSSVCKVPAINTFLRSASFPQLKDLSVQTYVSQVNNTQFYRPQDWIDFFRSLPSAVPSGFDTLSVFGIIPENSGLVGPSIARLPGLEKLSLKEFRITTTLFQPHTMDDLARIAQCWPDLEQLVLNDSKPRGNYNLDSLVFIATHLPNLKKLEMAIKLGNIEETNLDRIPILEHHLQDLSLDHLHGPGPRFFLKVVDRLFPHLQRWGFSVEEQDAEIDALWIDIEERLRDLQSARADQSIRERKM